MRLRLWPVTGLDSVLTRSPPCHGRSVGISGGKTREDSGMLSGGRLLARPHRCPGLSREKGEALSGQGGPLHCWRIRQVKDPIKRWRGILRRNRRTARKTHAVEEGHAEPAWADTDQLKIRSRLCRRRFRSPACWTVFMATRSTRVSSRPSAVIKASPNFFPAGMGAMALSGKW